MAALGNGAAIGKCVIKSKEIQGNPRKSKAQLTSREAEAGPLRTKRPKNPRR
jgi:hypothetical protein